MVDWSQPERCYYHAHGNYRGHPQTPADYPDNARRKMPMLPSWTLVYGGVGTGGPRHDLRLFEPTSETGRWVVVVDHMSGDPYEVTLPCQEIPLSWEQARSLIVRCRVADRFADGTEHK